MKVRGISAERNPGRSDYSGRELLLKWCMPSKCGIGSISKKNP